MDQSSHRWGPWDQHLFDDWGTHKWHFYRQCLDCGTYNTAPSYSICELKERAALELKVREAARKGRVIL